MDTGGSDPYPPSPMPPRDEPSSSSKPCWTDEEFERHLREELEAHPLAARYPDLFATAPKLIRNWRRRYRGNPSLWKRMFRKDRVLKEFVEAAPFVDAVRRLVASYDSSNGKKFTIVDLACGKGYLSMLLSELLPPDKVEKIVLVDRQWPMHNMEPQSHHISWTHIYGSYKEVEDQSLPRYFETWPIRLHTSKVDLKKSKEIRSLEQRLFRNKGPVILVAVHLCGTLSLKAVELFNNNPETRFFCLKPCCLPGEEIGQLNIPVRYLDFVTELTEPNSAGMVHAKRDEIFHLGEHSFDSKVILRIPGAVCMAGKWKKNKWTGPPRTVTKAYFERWADNLFLGMNDRDASKMKKTIMIQNDGGYQNEFLFAERLPETAPVWDALRQEQPPGEKAVGT
ncbi:hypothetical protein ACHAWF_009895 [Thalassiosira exigua]